MCCSGSPVSSVFVAPAVTPVKGVLQRETNNPGVRLFRYEPGDYTLSVSWYSFRVDSIYMHVVVVSLSGSFLAQLYEMYFILKSHGLLFPFYTWNVCQYFLSVHRGG
jgi:hypothetical protein